MPSDPVRAPPPLLIALLALSSLWAARLDADQRDPALPGLFERLIEADGPAEARRLESRIWHRWFEAPDDDAGALMRRIGEAMRSRNLERALEAADRLVETHPEFAEGWNRRATIHFERGDDDRSVADIHATLALEPRHFGAISGLGLIFLRRGDLESALEAFEQVLRISPESPSARANAERVRRELDREI